MRSCHVSPVPWTRLGEAWGPILMSKHPPSGSIPQNTRGA
jgi:hypothetical protein